MVAAAENAHVWTPERFFSTYERPEGVAESLRQVHAFVERHAREGRKVVLVTSGGTTAPLERNVVRYLDNFSAGTRGAASAEYFLAAGYAVIFLSRQHSQAPYTRLYSHTTNPFFDMLQEPCEALDGDHTVRVMDSQVARLLPILHSFHQVRKTGMLLSVPFVTVIEYLFLLRDISQALAPLKAHAMQYLAAAVSDFFVPDTVLPEHKIQSGDGTLQISMDPVPKLLSHILQYWAPEAYIASFKLETDENLIIPKSEQALRRNGHNLVIGNHLQRRKTEVVLVEHPGRAAPSSTSDGGDKTTAPLSHTWVRLPAEQAREREIEQDIVAAICARHDAWIRSRT